MTELCAKFTNIQSTNLILFEVVYYVRSISEEYPIKKNAILLLTERPGLQRITYSAKFDFLNLTKKY